MTMDLKVEQTLQDDEYAFPYHYVAQFRGNFRHCFLDTWSINYVSTIEYLLEKIAYTKHDRIVDIGCGDGRFSRELAITFPRSNVVGLDYSKRATELARAMNPDVRNLVFTSMDITQQHVMEPFEIAVLMEVFEHVPPDQTSAFLQGVRRVMKSGSVLLLTVPHANKPVEYKHFQHFTVDSLTTHLMPCFDVVEVVPFERISVLRQVMTRVLSNRLFVLNSGVLLRAVYRWYKKNLFICDSEKSCQRIFVKAIAR